MDYTEASGSRDPMELDRLAEELATRELKTQGSGLYPENHDLPVFIPLSHDNTYLSADTFNVEEFLLSRLYTSLPDLRSELRDYLANLKEELVKLINDDYEAFISLSTDLRGEGARLERLKWPLGDLREEVLTSRNELQHIQEAIQLKLEKRSALREEKAFLHLLLKISESVTRLESLLLIASPEDNEPTQTDIHGMKLARRLEEDAVDNRSRGNQAKHLARVASEYTQLLYHVSKARTDSCAFVDECQWRIDRIRSTLSSDLDHLFSTTLIALVEGKEVGKESRATEADKARWTSDVTECLRIYDVLGLWGDAEEVIRTDIVREFVKKTIYPGALAAPHSPIVPHTPFGTGMRQPTAAPQTATFPPRTPYTPFSAFAAKQNPFEASFSTQSQAPLLDDTDDPLASLYNTILRFVDRDMRRVMEIAEKVSVKTATRIAASASRTSLLIPAEPAGVKRNNEPEGGFEIMANVVWSEIGKAIMDELGGVVFAAGKPDEFRKHHETTQAFIHSLEFLAPSMHAVDAMRSHPIYVSFERRWQLPVYFQLRWKETVTKLEESLIVSKLERTAIKGIQPFATAQAAATWEAIATCWSADVFIPELNHRFWKLTLQLISRYRTWLQSVLPPLESTSKGQFDKLNHPSSPNLARSSTPNIAQAETSSPESIAADDALLQTCSIALTDIKALESQVWKLWHEEASTMLPDTSVVEDEDAQISLEDTLRHALAGVLSFTPALSSQIILILSRRGCDALLPMRSIPSQFRAMSSTKRLPTEPSHFVALIFRSLKAFFGIGQADGPGARLKNDYLEAFSEEVFEIVTQRYIYFLTAMKKTEESLRRLKRGQRSAFSLFGSSSAGKDDARADEEKIRAQMVLDVEAFGKEAQTLGVVVAESATYQVLRELANANLTDE